MIELSGLELHQFLLDILHSSPHISALTISPIKFQPFIIASSSCPFSALLHSNLFLSSSSVTNFLNPFQPCVCLPPLKPWSPESPMPSHSGYFLSELLPCHDFGDSTLPWIFSCIYSIYFHISEYMWSKVIHTAVFLLLLPSAYIMSFLNIKLNASKKFCSV